MLRGRRTPVAVTEVVRLNRRGSYRGIRVSIN
jgi:hypothetical protein